MLAIRLRRTGSKKRPFFRVVVTDSRTARDSSFVEVLGYYNPRTNAGDAEARSRAPDALGEARAPCRRTRVRTLVARMPEAPADAATRRQPAS